jgi:ribonuclease-3
MANVFGVKLSIDGKVIAKARATKKESGGKASQRAYFAFQEKMDKK